MCYQCDLANCQLAKIQRNIALIRLLFSLPYQLTINILDVQDNIDIGMDIDIYDI